MHNRPRTCELIIESGVFSTPKRGGLPDKVELNMTKLSRWIHYLVSYGGNIINELGYVLDTHNSTLHGSLNLMGIIVNLLSPREGHFLYLVHQCLA